MRHQNEKYIITASEEELKNRLRHVKMAVNSWKENKRNVNEQFAKSQVKFFSDEEKFDLQVYFISAVFALALFIIIVTTYAIITSQL